MLHLLNTSKLFDILLLQGSSINLSARARIVFHTNKARMTVLSPVGQSRALVMVLDPGVQSLLLSPPLGASLGHHNKYHRLSAFK